MNRLGAPCMRTRMSNSGQLPCTDGGNNGRYEIDEQE